MTSPSSNGPEGRDRSSLRGRIERATNYVVGRGLGPFLIRAVAGSGAVQIVGIAATFLVGVQLARGLGVEGYGYYGIAMAVIAIVAVPGEFGLPKLVTREVAAASANNDLPTLFGVIRWADRIALLIAVPAAGALALGAYLAFHTGATPVAAAIAIGAPIIPLIAFTKVRAAALQGMQFVVIGQVPIIALRPILFSVLLFGLFAIYPDSGAPKAMALNIVTAFAALLLAHVWLQARLPQPRPSRFTQTGRSWLASAAPMAINDGARIVQLQLAILLLGLFSTATEVGLFRISASMMIIGAIPITMIGTAIMPLLAELNAKGDQPRLQKLVTHAARLQFLGVFLASLPLLLWARPLLSIVFGAEYADAADAMRLLILAQIITAAFGPNAPLLHMSGHERRVTRALTVALVINMAAIAAFAPAWGIIAAAGGTALGSGAWNILAWRDARRLVGVDTSIFAAGSYRGEPPGVQSS